MSDFGFTETINIFMPNTGGQIY